MIRPASVLLSRGILAADILRPGRLVPDIVAVSPQLAQYWVVLNNGDGTFPASVTGTPVGVASAALTGIAIGDVTGDGNADLVFADASNNAVIVRSGHGDGTFAAPVSFSLGVSNVSPGSVAVADLNGDGKMDIVTGNVGSVTVLLNNGSGGLLPPTTTATGIVANCSSGCGAMLALDNLNADNKPDIVVTTTLANATQIAVLLNHGDGTFGSATTYPVGNGPFAIATGDVSGDQHADIAVANNSDSTVSVLLNHGDGTFASQIAYPVGRNPIAVALADQTRHGHLDLITAEYGGATPDTVTVLPGKGDGTFPILDYPVGKNPLDVLTADVSGDNKPDLLSVNHNDGITGSLSVLLNSGGGNFTPASGSPISISDSIFSLAAADFTGDTKTDVAVGGFNLTLLTGNGGGGFTVGSPILSLFGYFIATVAADLGNGHPDLVIADQNTNAVYVLMNDGHGNFTQALGSPIGLGVTPNALAVADGTVSVFTGDGTGHLTAVGSPITVNAAAGSIAVMDTNGDHKPDLILVNGASTPYDTVSVLLGNGNGTFGAPTALPADPYFTPSRYGSLTVADLNGDGVPDIAVTNHCSGGTGCPDVSLYAGNGDGTFTATNTYEVGENASATALKAMDVNEDGVMDLVVVGSTPFSTGVAGVMRNLSEPASAATHLVFSAAMPTPQNVNRPFAVQVLAEDANGNVVTGYAASVTLTLNGGSGLGGTLTKSMTGGGALFQGVTIASAGTGLTLTAMSGSLSVLSSVFIVTAPPGLLPPAQPTWPPQGSAPNPVPGVRPQGPVGGSAPNPLPIPRP